MINLMPPSAFRDIKAARLNSVLIQYAVMLGVLLVLVSLVYGVGFWIVFNEKKAIAAQLEQQNSAAQEFAAVQKDAKEFRTNLKTAKTIMSSGTPYSKFLTQLARDIPSGAMISGIAFKPGQAVAGKVGETEVRARTVSYDKAIELKTKLEISSLFEEVKIVSITRPDNIAGLSGLSSKYPFEAILTGRLSKVDFTQEGIGQ